MVSRYTLTTLKNPISSICQPIISKDFVHRIPFLSNKMLTICHVPIFFDAFLKLFLCFITHNSTYNTHLSKSKTIHVFYFSWPCIQIMMLKAIWWQKTCLICLDKAQQGSIICCYEKLKARRTGNHVMRKNRNPRQYGLQRPARRH